MKPYVITRSQYKKIKKLDHQEMSEFFERFIKNYIRATNQNTTDEWNKATDFHKECMIETLKNVKGIGEKRQAEFVEKYNEISKRRKNEITGGYLEKEEINA